MSVSKLEGLRLKRITIFFIAMVLIPQTTIGVAHANDLDGNENIDISLKERTTGFSKLEIGRSVVREFEITSVGGSSYVRVKVELGDDEHACSDPYGEPFESEWVLGEDGWWYCTEPMEKGERIRFSCDMTIRGNEPFIGSGTIKPSISLSEHIQAQAVDSISVAPDWDAAEPWVPIIQPIEDGSDEQDPNEEGADEMPKTVLTKDPVPIDSVDLYTSGNPLSETGDDMSVLTVLLISIAVSMSALITDMFLRAFQSRGRKAPFDGSRERPDRLKIEVQR